ncbi:hypothetical protein ACVWZ6_001435 [Bradyrhizobium sp. GM6.1]
MFNIFDAAGGSRVRRDITAEELAAPFRKQSKKSRHGTSRPL